METLLKVAYFTTFSGVCLIILGVFLEIAQKSRKIRRRKSKLIRQINRNSRREKSYPSIKVHLYRLTKNQAVAHQLVAQLRSKYPQQHEQWYWEKAIYEWQKKHQPR